MKSWRACCCFLIGHRFYQRTAGVEACERCGDARELGHRSWSRSEAVGEMVYPWSLLKEAISKHFLRLKAHLFCHQCGGLMFRRVERHFCSEKCEKEWFPF
jgi:hypothetical protein